jgi:hypothetical protein
MKKLIEFSFKLCSVIGPNDLWYPIPTKNIVF